MSAQSTLPLPLTGTQPPPEGSLRTARVGLLLGLAGIGMLFTAFSSAYVVRHGLDPYWQRLPMPRIVVAGTAVLLASSLCLERARRLGSQVWLLATLALGCGFVAAQLLAWRQLAAMGLYFASTPHSSFFYLLTATHGAHLAGGMFALARVAAMADQRRARWLEISAIYWHFMGVLWLYLVYLLFGMR